MALLEQEPGELRGKAQAESRRAAARGGRPRACPPTWCATARRCAGRPGPPGGAGASVWCRSASCARPRACRRATPWPSSRPTTRSGRSPICSAAVDGAAFQPFLLHGVTGSGKTEVYLRAVETALARGRGAILLVPEIALTPMLVRAARGRFGATVAVLHSELSAGERHDEWWRIREGEARVVVGARSAVFAPLPELGLIVVDEEHDGAYKQDDSPRYHGRDVAVMRARLEACPVVLGSATPSVESLRERRERQVPPVAAAATDRRRGRCRTVEIVDRRAVLRAGGEPILTPPLREALALRLERREQAWCC